ncbi:restriction endonuclease subunit S [Clostridium sp.]|uniref:restriction endonuclease subunit S n=1 Tax=Clostridium sp. TaxID=1506 RepID=UPI0029090B43|nr:restriction endonuclease subunit S [Clostridium sp.]MDU6542918.1 restriction endonuclease subunit S [Clostridium sp.]
MNKSVVKKLGDLVNIKTGKLDANAASENGKYHFFTCSVTPLKINSYSYDCECVLVAGNGDLNVKYYNGRFEAYQRTYIIESKDKEYLDTKYLYYFMSKYIEILRNQSIGGVIKYIKLANLTEAEIPVPSLKEQIRIVEILDKAQRVLDKKIETIDLINELVKSQFIEMFGSCEDTTATELENICVKITDGTHQSPKFVDKGIPFLLVSNIINNKIDYRTEKFISREEYEVLIKRTPIEIGDILLTSVGSYGNPAVVELEKEFCFQRHIAYLKPNKEYINSYYFHSALQTPYVRRQIDTKVKGIAQKTLNLSELKKIKINIPKLDKQKEFQSFYLKVDKLKFEMEHSLKELENNFNSLMKEAFSGNLSL